MAAAFYRPAAGWIAGRTTAGHAAQGERFGGGTRVDQDTGIDAQGRHSLVAGYCGRAEPEHGEPHLARLCSPSAPQRNLEMIERPAVHPEGSRYRFRACF